ncbi:MAG: asparagine synthase C-terminal domain-containing protein, partial [Acidobacteriia bacterium]|nr:asparagine synthase C-terminal domain-containing protein [Terriglobia bacterium]
CDTVACHPAIALDIDPQQIYNYLYFHMVPGPATAYRDVRRIPPAHCVEIEHGKTTLHRYWRMPFDERGSAPFADLRARFRGALDVAVATYDRPGATGTFLSGGTDSSTVAGLLARQEQRAIPAFSIGFDASGYDEMEYARIAAGHFGLTHHAYYVTPADVVAAVPRIAEAYDQPFGNASAVPTYFCATLARQHGVSLLLAGDGGDELFGGYESFFTVAQWGRIDRIPQLARRLLGRIAQWLPYSAYCKNYLRMISRPSALERYFEFNYAPYFMRARLLAPDWMLPADAGYLDRALANCLLPSGADTLSQAMYFEGTANLTGDMLVKVDRMSMANSLEVRCPLLDHELAEMAAGVPHAWKIAGGKGKRILIEALGDRLPAEVLARGKMGFGVPLAA